MPGGKRQDSATLAPATATDGAEIAALYLASRAEALPYLRRVHSDAAVGDWITTVLLPESESWVAWLDGRIVGFMALAGADLDQLYLRPGHYRRGIGSQLLAKAKQRRPNGLTLFTFQRNLRARAFYEAHGFAVVALSDGARNEEHKPDIRYAWRPET